MRNMSFSLTTQQIRDRVKTVTRRMGWGNLKPGTLIQACVKCMGLKPGEKIEKLCVIRIVSVTREPLWCVTDEDVAKEGFPGKTAQWFIELFYEHMKVDHYEEVNRIEFEYVEK